MSVAVMPMTFFAVPNSSAIASPWPLSLLYSCSSSTISPSSLPRYRFLMYELSGYRRHAPRVGKYPSGFSRSVCKASSAAGFFVFCMAWTASFRCTQPYSGILTHGEGTLGFTAVHKGLSQFIH